MLKRIVGLLGTGALVGATLVALTAAPAAATTVSTEADLRTAYSNAAETSIDLANDITLSDCGTGDLDRNSATALTINGNGHTIRQTCAGQRVMNQTGTGALTVENITLTGGTATGAGIPGIGGAIFTNGSVTTTGATITGNTAESGNGGIFAEGSMTLTNSTISDNTTADGGGGIGNASGNVTVTDSTISGNMATGGSGGAINAIADVTVTGSTISDNSASGGSGGIVTDGNVTVTDSTISGNTTGGQGGGINTGGAVTVTNSTISGNTAGTSDGGLRASGSVTLVYATVVANTAPTLAANVRSISAGLTTFGSVVALRQGGAPNCLVGTTTSNGYNYSDDSSCGLTGTGDTQNGGDPGLGALADNGGPTQTRLPAPTSPLLDVIPTASCGGGSSITADQRGVSRPQAATCDIGAVEVGRFFHALTPARILDTRTSIGGHPSPLGPGGSLNLTVAGQGGVPASGVSTVALNVTVTDTTGASFLTAWPAGQAQPPSSNLNWAPGVTIPNLVQVRVGTGGQVSFFNNNGSTDLIADVVGWYSDGSSATAAGYTSIPPQRILDTRTAIGGHPSPLGPGGSLNLTVTGQGGVPATGVSAVVLNVTVTNTTASSFLTAWPAGQARPPSSNLNWAPGVTIPNQVIAAVGTGGQVSFFNNNGSTDVIADVVGWYASGPTQGQGITSVSPARVLDTRTSIGGHQAPLGQGDSLDLTLTGVGGVPTTGVSAVVLNVTVTDTTAASFLTVWPSDVARPDVSNLNWAAGVTIPNHVVVRVPVNGKVSIFNNAGSTNVVADVMGWF